MYSDAEIREKQQLARAAGLSGAELLDDVAAIKKKTATASARRGCRMPRANGSVPPTRRWWWLLTFTTAGIAKVVQRLTGRPPTWSFVRTA